MLDTSNFSTAGSHMLHCRGAGNPWHYTFACNFLVCCHRHQHCCFSFQHAPLYMRTAVDGMPLDFLIRICTHVAKQHNCLYAEGKVFAVWRPVLISERDSRSIPDVELLQRLITLTDSAQCWVVILSKGGHFSAAVFDLRPVPPSQHSKASAPLFKELAHKSYHRYVVRCKLCIKHAGCPCSTVR